MTEEADAAGTGFRVPDGAIGHVEIPAEDLAAARAFYSGVFGWTFTDVAGMDRFVLFEDGGFGGGLNGYPQEHGAGICPYVQVADIDATLAAVEESGGEILQPRTEIGGGHGFVARFRDPNGNGLGLWSKG